MDPVSDFPEIITVERESLYSDTGMLLASENFLKSLVVVLQALVSA